MMAAMTAQIRLCDALAFLRKKARFSTIVHCCLFLSFSAAAFTVQAQSLTGVQSRKIHGSGIVAYDLPVATNQSITGNVTVESRAIGAGHRIVFQFDSTITSAGTLSVVDETSASVAAQAPVIAGASSQEIIVTIPVLPDNKRVSISLNNINGIVGLNAAAALGFRLGDTNNSGTVTSIDVSSIRARSGQVANATNFQYDLNTTGLVSAADVSTVKSRSGLYVVNTPPVVNAGTNQTITLPAVATLTGTASDDGLPNPPNALTLSWTRFSGPATVAFGNASAASTTASFTASGTYVLRLTATDGQLSTNSDVTITVNPGAASLLTVAGLTSPRTAGVAGTVTVTAKDAFANVATGYRGTIQFTSSDVAAVLPGNYTFTAGDNGVHTFAVTLNTVGTRSVTATDVATAAITGSQAGISVTANVLPGLFEKPHPWNKDVSALAPDVRSSAIIGALLSLGGFGNNKLQTDFSIAVLNADSTTPRRAISAAPGYYVDDADTVPLSMPLPLNGNTEGNPNYTCDRAEDCHVLVVERTEKKLYELYNATDVGGTSFIALGAFVWDLTKQYTDVLRGDQCTSADAAGLPMAALIPTADEVAAGEVPHALRFILPNDHMKKGSTANGVYVRPATHAGGPSNTTNADAPPYGVRFRLQANFNEATFTPGAQVILRAMKKYGMILSDGGSIALTFADDRLSTAKWATLGITAQTFNNIPVTAFDVVDLSAEIVNTFNCVRAP